MKALMISLLLLCSGSAAEAAYVWELQKDMDGIRVYTSSIPNSNIKAVKVTCTVNASASQLTALLLDAKAHEKWVYNTKRSYVIQQPSAGTLVYYSELGMPWPLANRDVVIELNISQVPATKIIHISAHAADNVLPVYKDKVRVLLSKADWVIIPIGDNALSIEYTAQTDPGGDIPAWIANIVTTRGPFETFKKLKEVVASPAYQYSKFDFVTN